MSEQKPTLHLTRGKGISVDTLAMMFKNFTGRDPTPEELERAKKRLQSVPTRSSSKE